MWRPTQRLSTIRGDAWCVDIVSYARPGTMLAGMGRRATSMHCLVLGKYFTPPPYAFTHSYTHSLQSIVVEASLFLVSKAGLGLWNGVYLI